MGKKTFKYEVGDELIANEKCKRGLPSMPGRRVTVHRQLEDSVLYDYETTNENGVIYRFKEEELDIPAPYKEEISC